VRSTIRKALPSAEEVISYKIPAYKVDGRVVIYFAGWTHAFDESVNPAHIRTTVTAYRVGWLTYTLATVVALFLPVVSFALYISIALYYVVPRGVDDDLGSSHR
jgi:hypothetical protein